MTLSTYSRADGHSAVKAAAYRARASFLDRRTGLRHSYRGRTGLLSDEVIGWQGSAEDLWNAAEAAETRSNARIARELRPALPAELPFDQQVRLVRGFALWLRDRYGVALQAVIHAPTFAEPEDGRARAAEFRFHPTQVLEPQDDESLIVRFTAAGWLEMAWHLYQWGDKVEVIAPDGLRTLVEGYRRSDFDALP